MGIYTHLRTRHTVLRFEIFTAVTMKNGVFWDVTPCGSCKNRRFGEHSASFIRVTRICELGTTLALISASVVPSSPILVTLMKEALSFSSSSSYRYVRLYLSQIRT
jgi:hypothetical protein